MQGTWYTVRDVKTSRKDELINKLDLIYRDVVVLMQMGYSYEAIANILGITVETARKRYSRAKAKLKEMGGKNLYV